MTDPPPDEVRIRAARPEEAERVLAVWDQARSPAAVTPDDANVVAQLLAHAEDALLVAEVDGELVGVLIAAWDGWRGNMYRLAVLPAHRRKGIARRLVETGHELLRAKGAGRVTALVAEAEAEAVGAWLSFGYERDQQIVRFVRDL